MAKKESASKKQLSIKIRSDLAEKLDEAKWAFKLSKQDVVEKALEELFKRHGIK